MAVAEETNASRTWMWRWFCSIDLVLKENKISICALVLKEKKISFRFLSQTTVIFSGTTVIFSRVTLKNLQSVIKIIYCNLFFTTL
jgi:hypothetical protein